jgi:hypothetical protein
MCIYAYTLSFQPSTDMAGAIFGYTPNKVLSKDAAEIDNANLLRQNDHLYLIDDQIDAQEPDYIPEGFSELTVPL